MSYTKLRKAWGRYDRHINGKAAFCGIVQVIVHQRKKSPFHFSPFSGWTTKISMVGPRELGPSWQEPRFRSRRTPCYRSMAGRMPRVRVLAHKLSFGGCRGPELRFHKPDWLLTRSSKMGLLKITNLTYVWDVHIRSRLCNVPIRKGKLSCKQPQSFFF
jgi:hypothetical protein